ncbi:MAG: hypothetical protein PHV34_19070 [Verrucomicrobiae bacterium]|nr:hypothetical protein [Verrucomicrobiae bacterium]
MKTNTNKQQTEGLESRPEQSNINTNQTPFGNIISTYTRKQALADGVQVDVSETAKEAGIRFPVFLTRSVFEAYVTVPADVSGQDEAGRLWDLVWMLRHAIIKSKDGQIYLPFSLYVRNDNRKPRLVNLVAVCGALDMDDPQPAITVMLPDED